MLFFRRGVRFQMARSDSSFKKLKTPSDSALTEPGKAPSRKSHRLQDAVYREMFLLEAKRPGAEMGLALALLRVMAASNQMANREEIRDWLATICPHCLKMIERSLNEYGACAPRTLKDAAPVILLKP